MDIYEKLNDAIYCDDLLVSASRLINFAELALLEKTKPTIIKHFYERLQSYALTDYAFEGIANSNKKRYLIYDGKNAISKYLVLAMPKQETPVKTLNAIRSFGQQILSSYKMPVGKAIKKEKIEEIMQYLDNKYNFSQKIFSNRKAVFAILNYSHEIYNSECLIAYSDKEVIQHLFLYCMEQKGKNTPTPEAVFFHELGHAIHARYVGNIETIPSNILIFLKQLCMPTIETLTPEQQSEVFADILSVGMMYGSPFEEYDCFTYMHPDDKKAFRMFFEKILEQL